ncbi:MAG: serine/threonine protein kinase, partial [Deltaproteobacteria bacterium]|nr:serine/threonine protein kinase [Deltaproteobacteria bacterium]
MTLVAGQQIGQYRIERPLGSGGMGVVYIAMDMRLGRRAAIKQLLPALSSDHDIVERFFNEAKAAASINHPSIVEIYDVGWHSDGSAFFAMKLLEGESIARRMRTVRQFPLEIASTIARQVATALGAAHARGIVHRDLKPDNVMLVRDDEVVIGERAIVLDFGIAKLFGENPAVSKTRTGVFMGTPAYMSPEQCRGAADVDQRTDVYALGCIVFEMLAGRPPFIAQGGGEIVGMHQFVAPPDVRSLRSDVPEPLAALIARSLAKNPAERVASMHDFAIALGPFAVQGVHTMPAGQGVTQLTAPPSIAASTYTRGQVSAPPTKSRALAFVFGVIAMLAVTALAIVVTCRPSSDVVNAPADAAVPYEAGDRVAVLRAAVKKAIARKDWVDAQIAVQKWIDTANDSEAQEYQRKVMEETAAERAFQELTSAANEKRHLDGRDAFERIAVTSSYRDRAIEIMARLRLDYISKKTKEARELAAAHKCKELGALQQEASRMG